MSYKSMLLLAAAALVPSGAIAQTPAPLTLGEAEYYTAPAVNYLVFSNWYDGLFADSKISGVEIIQQDRASQPMATYACQQPRANGMRRVA